MWCRQTVLQYLQWEGSRPRGRGSPHVPMCYRNGSRRGRHSVSVSINYTQCCHTLVSSRLCCVGVHQIPTAPPRFCWLGAWFRVLSMATQRHVVKLQLPAMLLRCADPTPTNWVHIKYDRFDTMWWWLYGFKMCLLVCARWNVLCQIDHLSWLVDSLLCDSVVIRWMISAIYDKYEEANY